MEASRARLSPPSSFPGICMSTTPLYDAIVIGAGHNGLASACYLAAEGRKVIVVESLGKVGGMASSGYLIPEAPNHLVHPCALDLMSLRVHPMMPQELQLERHGFRQTEMEPGYVYLHPDGNSLVFGRSAEQTAAEIRRFSTADATEFLALMQLVNTFIDLAIPMMRVDPAQMNLGAKWQALKVLIKNRHLRPELMGLMKSPAYTSIMERFEHPVTQSALCCLLGAAGPITGEGTGVYFALLGFIQRFGLGRAVGGMQTLSDALAARLTELGGEIRLNAPAAEIVARGGQTQGVRLASGEVLESRSVVAAVHPKIALNMVTPGAIERRYLTRVDLAPANAHGGSPMKIDVALRGQVRASRHEALRADGLSLRKSVLLIGTVEAVLDNFKCAARGDVSRLPYLWATAPSAVDPTQAPEGQDIAYLYPIAMPLEPREGWDAIRAPVTQMVIDQTDAYLPGLKSQEIGRRAEAAPDFASRLNVPNGCVVHIDTGASRTGLMRPAFGLGGDTLPVKGLFFGGAGIHPGGGINGLPGRIAAGRVKRYLK
ncbi:NAD(P)/FAD-dependent oxidoreductase [uncultured Aquabacterium sp.]|nr:NAD(P)/FAD-dependent oxidoreductase [uncultured Aquabacterium sp.]